MKKVIDAKILDDVKKYILGSVIPSRDAQELVRMLNTAEEIKEEVKNERDAVQ